MNYALIKKLLPWCLMAGTILALEAGAYHLGYKSAERRCQQLMAEQRLAASNAALQAAEAARAKEQENAKKLAEALAARDKALARAEFVRRDAVRVRVSAAGTSRKLADLSRAHAASGDGNAERLARCEGLLGEGVQLVGEGAGLAGEGSSLLERVSADKDAIMLTTRLN